MLTAALAITATYLLGCFNTGYYLTRWLAGRDIRETASGNTGSRNVGRLLGAKGFALTFIGDAGKGVAAVWLSRHLGGDHLLETVALLAVTLGHIWPLQLGFRGGKGFATFAGGMILLYPVLLLAGLGLCALVYPFARGTTKTGLIALACSPIPLAASHIIGRTPLLDPDFVLYCLLVITVLFAHRSNIRKEFGTNTTSKE